MGSEELVFEVVTAGAKIAFRDGGLMSNLKNGPEKVLRAASLAAQRSAPDVENYMKTEAPWQDQTGNARGGLGARAYREGDSVGIVLFHSVDYGIYLEARWNGRYAIIQPAIDAMGPVVMRRFDRLLERDF